MKSVKLDLRLRLPGRWQVLSVGRIWNAIEKTKWAQNPFWNYSYSFAEKNHEHPGIVQIIVSLNTPLSVGTTQLGFVPIAGITSTIPHIW